MASKKLVKTGLAELRERVPPKQMPKFAEFLEKNAKYKARVSKLPDHLPNIDWDSYRLNVRSEYKRMVDEFEQKYEELNKMFDDRVNIDQSKYFEELEKQRAEVQQELNEYVEESNKRIKEYEAQLEHVKALKPYEQMTCEEFVELTPEAAKYYPSYGKNLFWPFTPEEQGSGPVGAAHDPESLTNHGAAKVETEGSGEVLTLEKSSSEAKAKLTEAKKTGASKNIIEELEKEAAEAEAKLARAQAEKLCQVSLENRKTEVKLKSEEGPKKEDPKHEDPKTEVPKKTDPKGQGPKKDDKE